MRLKSLLHTLDFYLLSVLACGVYWFYFPTATAGFVTDFTGMAEKLETRPFSDWITCFGFPAMEQLRNLALALFYKAFGTSGYAWYFIFTTLHILNAFLLYRLGFRYFSGVKIRYARAWAYAAALLFAFHPYNVEPLVWRVNFVFLFTTSVFLAAIHLYHRWRDTDRRKYLWTLHLLFAVALFTFELSLALPVVLSSLIFFECLGTKKPFFKPWLPVILPQVSLLGIYFFLQKKLVGDWVGHYGAETHLNFDPSLIFGNLLKYISKNLFFSRNLTQPQKEQLYGFLEEPIVWGACLVFVLGALLLTILKADKLKPFGRLTWTLFSFYVLCLLPVLNIFFYFLLHIENDRYSYLPSVFFMLLLTLFLSKIPKYLGVPLLLIYAWFNFSYAKENVRRWSQSDQIYRSLLADFRWENADNVYILSLPDNYEGAGLFRRYRREDSGIADALRYIADKDLKATIHEITNFNQHDKFTGFKAQPDSTGLITLQFNGWGSWWWDCGHGTSGFATDAYDFKARKGRRGEFRIKELKGNDVIIYADGTKWREVNFE